MAKSNLIFVDVFNATVSQMAEAFAKQIAPENIGVYSAGTEPTKRVDADAIEVMKEYGIDISKQKTNTKTKH